MWHGNFQPTSYTKPAVWLRSLPTYGRIPLQLQGEMVFWACDIVDVG